MIDTAIVLSAGRGERLRPLTDTTPKPLIEVGGQPLIAWHLRALARAGVRAAVINTAWREACFEPLMAQGPAFGLALHWSREGRDHGDALETAGGIAKALPHLGTVFWVVAADVFVPQFDFNAETAARVCDGEHLAHLWMVPNAEHHPQGDFALDARGLLRGDGQPRLTWASVGVFSARLFQGVALGERLALRPLLQEAAARNQLGGSLLPGHWTDVGTAERLQRARRWAETARHGVGAGASAHRA